MKYNNILAHIFGDHWYATAEMMEYVVGVADNIFAGKDLFAHLDRIQGQMEAANNIQGSEQLGRTGTRGNEVQLIANGTAVVPIRGVIAPKVSAIAMCTAGTSMDMLTKRANELRVNSDVKRVVLHINSGGGSVLGVPEAANALRELAKVKPVTAYFDYIGASAAYFLASAAGLRVVTSSSVVGSIGVYQVVHSMAGKLEKDGIEARIIRRGAFKAMPNPIEPLSEQEAGLAKADASVERHYRVFINALHQNLGISMANAELLADGSISDAKGALEKGLVDVEGTFEDVVSGKIQADVVGATEPVIPTEANAEAKAEEATETPTADVQVVEVVENAELEEAKAKVSEDVETVAELKAKIMLLEQRVEASNKALETVKESTEAEKISALIATGVEDGRIANMKADQMTALATEMGYEKFVTVMESMTPAPVMEDLSTPPAEAAKSDSTVATNDPDAPVTEEEIAMFRNIPALKAKYNL